MSSVKELNDVLNAALNVEEARLLKILISSAYKLRRLNYLAFKAIRSYDS